MGISMLVRRQLYIETALDTCIYRLMTSQRSSTPGRNIYVMYTWCCVTFPWSTEMLSGYCPSLDVPLSLIAAERQTHDNKEKRVTDPLSVHSTQRDVHPCSKVIGFFFAMSSAGIFKFIISTRNFASCIIRCSCMSRWYFVIFRESVCYQ